MNEYKLGDIIAVDWNYLKGERYMLSRIDMNMDSYIFICVASNFDTPVIGSSLTKPFLGIENVEYHLQNIQETYGCKIEKVNAALVVMEISS